MPLLSRIQRTAFAGFARLAPTAAAQLAFKLWFRTTRYPVPAEEQAVLARSTRSEVAWGDGQSIQLYVWGDGPIALLTHGWNGRASQFFGLIDYLTGRGFKVVAFDAPAHGASSGTEADLPSFTAAFQAVRGELGPVALVISHSLGALAVGRAMAEGAQATRWVMIAPPTSLADVVERNLGEVGLSAKGRLKFRALLDAKYGSGIWERFDFRHMPQWQPGQPAVAIIHDTQDKEIPYAWGEKVSRHLPKSSFITTEGLGHRRILRDEKLRTLIGTQLDAAGP